MIEQASHQRPGFAGIASFKQRSGFHAAVEHVRLVARAECYLPNILQGDSGIGGKSNGCLLRVGPALPEVVSGSQEGAPITLCGCPYATVSSAAVIGHRIHALPVKIGSANLPTAPLSIRAKDECSLCGSNQQKGVSLLNMNVLHAVQHGSSWRVRL